MPRMLFRTVAFQLSALVRLALGIYGTCTIPWPMIIACLVPTGPVPAGSHVCAKQQSASTIGDGR